MDGMVCAPLRPAAADAAATDGDGVYYEKLHDDVVMASSHEENLSAAIGAFSEALAEVGLQLGAKSVLVAGGGVGEGLAERVGRRIVKVAKCAGAPLWVPGSDAEAGAMLESIAEKAMKPLVAVDGVHTQDIVRVLRHAGPWSRLGYVAALIPGFPDEWLRIAVKAHRGGIGRPRGFTASAVPWCGSRR